MGALCGHAFCGLPSAEHIFVLSGADKAPLCPVRPRRPAWRRSRLRAASASRVLAHPDFWSALMPFSCWQHVSDVLDAPHSCVARVKRADSSLDVWQTFPTTERKSRG